MVVEPIRCSGDTAFRLASIVTSCEPGPIAMGPSLRETELVQRRNRRMDVEFVAQDIG